jgi:membrane associated rhomboid family serine protease
MAFFQEQGDQREPFFRAPAIVFWLIGLILVSHAARTLLFPEPAADQLLIDHAFIPDRFTRADTWVTYLFLHGSWTHAGINSLWLLAFGPPVAGRLGTPRFLLFYLVCGFAAALAQLASDWGSSVPVVGASGAIAGLMGGAIRILYGGRWPGFGPPPPLAPILSRPLLLFSGLWLAVNVVAGLTGLGLTGEGEVVAWVAHMGGFAAGLLAIGFFDPAAPSDSGRVRPEGLDAM